MIRIAQEVIDDGKIRLFETNHKPGNRYDYIIHFRIIFSNGYFLRFDSTHMPNEVIDILMMANRSGLINESEIEMAVNALIDRKSCELLRAVTN